MQAEQLWVVAGSAYAMLLGGAIGLEREFKNRPAGFRTHMLVAGASSLLIGLGQLIVVDPRFRMPFLVNIDPLRLVEAVVAGVAFIGAGTIFARRRGQAVAGITTAASLLMVAVIGACTGLRYHLLAFAATALTLGVLALLNLFERKVGSESPPPGNDDDSVPR
ncbi:MULTISPECIES: MgtC/SapB family protein [Lysobacter]|uniref:Protein MgtC n=1 Tax=Lysobacter firmicutimachus TaxID=1792846 RepID=A0ABU8D2J4_9GAMM|nr:MgtC/SapB family protein [Lysobacter antibioticus]